MTVLLEEMTIGTVHIPDLPKFSARLGCRADPVQTGIVVLDVEGREWEGHGIERVRRKWITPGKLYIRS